MSSSMRCACARKSGQSEGSSVSRFVSRQACPSGGLSREGPLSTQNVSVATNKPSCRLLRSEIGPIGRVKRVSIREPADLPVWPVVQGGATLDAERFCCHEQTFLPPSIGGMLRKLHRRAERAARHGGKTRYNRTLKLAIIGYGNVGRALTRLQREKRKEFPFTVTGIHTLRHGTAVDAAGLATKVMEGSEFGPRAASVEEFLEAARAQVAVELTTLNPSTGEPAAGHIRAAMARHMHVVTANKGPVAHVYAALRD